MRNVARASPPALLVLALLVAGCGPGSASGSRTTALTESGSTVHVVMRSLAFAPAAVNARVGQRVVWTNQDSSPHNVTYVSGPRFTSSRVSMKPGARFSLRLTTPGTIHYFCTLHPWMKATIDVSP